MRVRPIKEIQYKCKTYNRSNYKTILKKIKWNEDSFCADLESEILLQIYKSFSYFRYPQYFKEELESVAPEIAVADIIESLNNCYDFEKTVFIEVSNHNKFKQDKLENPQWFEV